MLRFGTAEDSDIDDDREETLDGGHEGEEPELGNHNSDTEA